jgi:hypothetical protein
LVDADRLGDVVLFQHAVDGVVELDGRLSLPDQLWPGLHAADRQAGRFQPGTLGLMVSGGSSLDVVMALVTSDDQA